MPGFHTNIAQPVPTGAPPRRLGRRPDTAGALMRLAPVLLVALLCLVLAGGVTAAQTPAVTAYDPESLLAIAPDHRAAVAAALEPGLTTYEIDLTMPDTGTNLALQGRQTVTYTNTTGTPLADLPFRLYANSAADDNNAVIIDEALIDGDPAPVDLSVNNSVATVHLPAPLPPGESVIIDMAFTTTPDRDDPRHYGIFNYTTETQTWSLAHWYPVVAGRDPGSGWMLEPTSVYGDPIFTETALYTVEITAPAGMQLVTSGVETGSRLSGDRMVTTFNAWPSRDFAIIASPDLESVTTMVGDTTIASWYEPGTDDAGLQALEWGVEALELFNDLLGTYPYLQLNIASADIFNAAGVEFPQMVTVARGYYRAATPSTHFEFTVAHEVVHQWFFNLVGNNQYAHAFMDESLTNYLSSEVFFSRVRGQSVADRLVQRTLTGPYERAVNAGTDPIVNFPTDAFPSSNSYVVAVYSKGPLGFAALHDAMGDDAFFAALRAYVADYSFRVATPDDLLAAFQHATNIDILPIWTHWFNERTNTPDTGT